MLPFPWGENDPMRSRLMLLRGHAALLARSCRPPAAQEQGHGLDLGCRGEACLALPQTDRVTAEKPRVNVDVCNFNVRSVRVARRPPLLAPLLRARLRQRPAHRVLEDAAEGGGGLGLGA